MIYLLLFCFIICGCSHNPSAPKEELVSLDAALNQAQASYLLGCVDAFHDMKQSKVFEHCSEKAKKHRLSVDQFVKSR